jgi:hypothetical protein
MYRTGDRFSQITTGDRIQEQAPTKLSYKRLTVHPTVYPFPWLEWVARAESGNISTSPNCGVSGNAIALFSDQI